MAVASLGTGSWFVSAAARIDVPKGLACRHLTFLILLRKDYAWGQERWLQWLRMLALTRDTCLVPSSCVGWLTAVY